MLCKHSASGIHEYSASGIHEYILCIVNSKGVVQRHQELKSSGATEDNFVLWSSHAQSPVINILNQLLECAFFEFRA